MNRNQTVTVVLLTAVTVVALITLAVDMRRLGLLLVPVSFLLAAHGASRLADRWAGPGWLSDGIPPILTLVVRLTLGLAVLGWLHVAGSFSGWFQLIGFAVAACLIVELAALANTVRQTKFSFGLLRPSLCGLAFGLLWALAWLWGTIPPVFYDELTYHLVIPQRALASGALPAWPWSFLTFMPCLSDLLLGWGLMLAGELGAHALHLGLWAVLTLAVWGLADSISGGDKGAWSSTAATLALASAPTAWYLGTLPFSECLLSLSMLASLGFLFVAPESPRRGWLFGLLLGLGSVAKLSGVAWAGAGLAAAMLMGWPKRDLLRGAAMVAISLAPWWSRAVYYTGNPLYPVGYHLFGGQYWSEASEMRLRADNPPAAGDLGLSDLLRLPLDMVMDPDRFASGSHAGALAVGSVCLLLVLPVLTRILATTPDERRRGDALASFAWIAAASWVATTTATRYLSPALLLGLAVLAGVAMRGTRPIRIGALCLLLLGGVWGTHRFLTQHDALFSSSSVALGRESPEQYLARRLDHAEAAKFVREHTPPDARVLFIGETRPYYFSRDAVAPHPINEHPLAQWVTESSSPEALRDRLRAEGMTHVVLNIREFRRLHDKYGVLAFTGELAQEHDDRLKRLPPVLQQLFTQNHIYVFAVPAAQHGQAEHRRPPDIKQYLEQLDRPERDQYQKPEQVVQALGLKEGMAVADLGAGSGYFTRRFVNAVTGAGKVYAIDVKQEMLAYTKTSIERLRIPSTVEFILAKPDDPMLPSGSVDLIFLCNVYHHLEDRAKYFANVKPALKSGGRVAIVDFYHDTRSGDVGFPRRYLVARETVVSEMEKAGYRLLREHAFLPRQYFLEFVPITP